MLGTIELIQYGCAGLKIAAKALKATDKMMLGKNSLKVATDSIGLIKAGKANMLDDIASITRTQKGYEFVTTDGIIFKMLDDDIPAAAKSVVKSMSDSTDELMTCLKREPEALFELVEETKELDNTILYRLRDDTEIQLFKSDLTPEQIICSTIGCFTGDTLVTTKEGLKRIDEVKTGDYVLSKDVKSGEIGYKKVNYVYIKNTNKLVQLIVGTEEINTTSSHLFFTDSGWWKSAKNIKVGDRILTDDGELKEVTGTKVVELEEPVRIYNLNVDEFHTYFVGSQGLLVHNNCTAEMMGAGREAIANARSLNITDSAKLSEIGNIAADIVYELGTLGLKTEQNITRATRLAGAGVSKENIINVIRNNLDSSPFIQKKILNFEEFKYLDSSQKWCLQNAIDNGYIDISKWMGKISGNFENLTVEEWNAVNKYLINGKDLYRIPEGNIKTPDFLIDGVKIEFKGINAQTFDNIRTQALKYANESFPPTPSGKNADRLVLDCAYNNLDINLEQAEALLNEIKQLYPNKVVEIWTKFGDFFK
ncbi:polymorphic toxin-type HINT domain-containing protein [Acetivibrio clariflavus]|nr:polymorphic toxin-type HINT domain-containing protein [Acetivibrio clariflavus]